MNILIRGVFLITLMCVASVLLACTSNMTEKSNKDSGVYCAERSFELVDNLVSELPRAKLDNDKMHDAIKSLQIAQIGYEQNSNDWITVFDEHFVAYGAILPIAEIKATENGDRTLMLLAVPEIVSGVTIFHIVPLIETWETSRSASLRHEMSLGSSVSDYELEKYFQNLWESDIENTVKICRVKFSVHDGWIHADLIETLGHENIESSRWTNLANVELSFIDLFFNDFFEVSPETFEAGALWLEIRDGKEFDTGLLNGSYILSPNKELSLFTLLARDRLASATIFHAITVCFEQGGAGLSEEAIDEILWEWELRFRLEGDRFVFAG